MSNGFKTKNKVVISGNWEYLGIKVAPDKKTYYHGTIHCMRDSGNIDHIPVYFDYESDYIKEFSGHQVTIVGKFSSMNEHDQSNGRSKLLLFVLAQSIRESNDDFTNRLHIRGFICKKPNMRETPLGKTVCDLLIATNDDNGEQSQYMPCIAWGNGARIAGSKKVGDPIEFEGRIQSRVYQKVVGDTKEDRVAYEVSINTNSLCVAEEKICCD